MLAEHYKAAHDAAVITELDSFGIVKLTGADRISWLQGMVTNDVAKLAVGAGCYAAHLTPQGKIVAHMDILKDEDALFLSLERAAIPKLLTAFDKLLIMEDVQIEDLSQELSALGLFGPKAAALLDGWTESSMDLHHCLTHRKFEDTRIVRSVLGYEIWLARTQTDGVLRYFAEHGATPVDQGTWDVLRTEAGIPIYGIDIDESTTLPELGERGINYEKGCYIGQEVVAKVKYLGHVNRRFTGLILSSDDLPEAKTPIRKGGRDVGYVTTALLSPVMKHVIALGFVSRSAYAVGTEVEVGSATAKIVDLPFRPLAA